MIPLPGAVWRYGAAFALGALAAATAQGWRYGEQIARAEAAISAERSEAMRQIVAGQDASTARMAAADKKFTGELTDAEAEIARLERSPKRLYVAAKCPAASPLPEAGTDAGLGGGDGERPELDAGARADYFTLRRGIARVEAALKACVEGR